MNYDRRILGQTPTKKHKEYRIIGLIIIFTMLYFLIHLMVLN